MSTCESDDSKPILITSALPYVNNVPHLGNIYQPLSGDVYNRFMKMTGHKTLYLCGTDEYGTTTEVKAMEEKLSCQEICDKYYKLHKNIYEWFGVEFDIFGRTSTSTQTEVTHEIFLRLLQNGHIEKKSSLQHYCNECNMFLADRFIQGHCYHEKCLGQNKITNGDQCDYCNVLIESIKLENPWCSVCKKHGKNSILDVKETIHLYLNLEPFENMLAEYFIGPAPSANLTPNAIGITSSWLDKGLESQCITRDLKWGTPVPNVEGLEDVQGKVFYVWFDAPIGYMSILKHGRTDWKEWLGGRFVQFMAKDNVRFHTIIYPATLLGSNLIYPLVTDLISTEYLNYEEQKFSKSKNIGIFGDHIIEISSLLSITSDYWRYYLMKIRPETKDSSFQLADFVHITNTDLLSKIGNFINRVFSLSKKYFAGEFDGFFDNDVIAFNDDIFKRYCKSFKEFHFREATNLTCSIAEYGNEYLQLNEPWKKKDMVEIQNIIANATIICTNLLRALYPIMPNLSNELSKRINIIRNIDDHSNAPITPTIAHITINYDGYQLPIKKLNLAEVVDQINKILNK
jgi:methionyl-tRNA synthetase